MNTAQKIRVWLGVGIGALLALSVWALNDVVAPDPYTTNVVAGPENAFYGWFVLAMLCLAAEAVLAVFTIHRMYHPLPAERPCGDDEPHEGHIYTAGYGARCSGKGQDHGV